MTQHRDWSDETKHAYLACAIDTDGWIGLGVTHHKDGHVRICPRLGVTNQSLEFLERITDIAEVPLNISRNGKIGRDSRGIVTRGDVWQVYWRSPLHVAPTLQKALPYLVAKQQRAEWALEFVLSRISNTGHVIRSGKPYTPRCLELAKLVTEANGGHLDIRDIQLPDVFGEGRKTHGASGTVEHKLWTYVKARDPMCDQWKASFTNFLADMGSRPSPKHQLTRRNKQTAFSPSNCYWGIRGQPPPK